MRTCTLTPVTCLSDWNRWISERTVEYAIGDPVVRGLGIMDPVPADRSSRILTRTTKHLGAVDHPFISAPDMVVILVISTANLEGVNKSCKGRTENEAKTRG